MQSLSQSQKSWPGQLSRPAQIHAIGNAAAISALDEFEEANTLAIVDDRALDRECLAQSLIAHGLNMNVRTYSSLDMWKESDGRNISGILINTGHRDFHEKQIVDDIKRLIAEYPGVSIVVLSDNQDLRQMLLALELGVKGYIPSAIGLSVCVQAISLALAGGIFISAENISDLHRLLMVADQKGQRRAEMFTSREENVIDALTQGKPNKIIAYELNLRESTVKVHIRNIMKKLKARNRTEVIFRINGMFN
ncbi:LuxR C-terminal-related transcriptional regulator [Rhizobium sp. RAF56]|uniref:LuxR C-terminal-related transcriptional regulator n=1 Tax=Rhizobium sp. RAF56 TaxID=3233062 RepID=UPI003F9CEA69